LKLILFPITPVVPFDATILLYVGLQWLEPLNVYVRAVKSTVGVDVHA